MLAAMAKHACKPGLNIYHIASSMVNPIYSSSIVRFLEEHFQEEPLIDNTGKPIRNKKFQAYRDVESYMEALSQVVLIPKVYENFTPCSNLHTMV